MIRSRAGTLVRMLGAPAARLLGGAARWLPLRRGVVVMYHGVGDRQGDWRHELVPALGARLFESQLLHMRRLYRVVPASQILEASANRRRGERFPVAITFDDDLESHVRIAAPVLSSHDTPATFFLTGASMDRPYAFWWQNLQRASDLGRPILELVPAEARDPVEDLEHGVLHSVAETIERMPTHERADVAERLQSWVGADVSEGLSRDDVASLAGAGCEIGFHTLDHHRLPTLDDTALMASMHDGRGPLEKAAGRRVELIAYPHGAADARVAEAAAAAGYRAGFTAEPQPVSPATDRFLIGRVGPSYASTGHFAIKVALTLLRKTRSGQATPVSGLRVRRG